MNAAAFFADLAKLGSVNEPHARDQTLVRQFAVIGLTPRGEFDLEKLEAARLHSTIRPPVQRSDPLQRRAQYELYDAAASMDTATFYLHTAFAAQLGEGIKLAAGPSGAFQHVTAPVLAQAASVGWHVDTAADSRSRVRSPLNREWCQAT